MLFALVGSIFIPMEGEAEAAAPAPKDTIAVLFSYPWNTIAEQCETVLGPAGYGYVQTSPPQEAIQNSAWWSIYQPVSYKLESTFGTEAEFQSMVNRCNAAGVEVIADAVINHMSGQPQGGVGTGGTRFEYFNYPGLYSPQDFHSCDRNISDYGDKWEVQECRLVGLSDLNTGSQYVQQTIADYLNKLIDMGVAGFRIDAVKHIASEDMDGIFAKVKNKDSIYVVQEVIGSAGEPIQPSEYTHLGDVHEFNYGRKLKEAFGGSSINYLISGDGIGTSWGFLPQSSAAVFVDNHDTERNGETLSYKDGATYDLAQIFTLAWNYGSPSIQSGFAFTDYDAGPAMSNGKVIAPVKDQNGWTFKHAQNNIANMVGFRNQTYGKDVNSKWDNGSNAIAFGRGTDGFVVINNGNGSLGDKTFTTKLPDGEYYNVIEASKNASGVWSGPTITVANGKFTANVGGKNAVALHTGATAGPACEDTQAPTTPTNVKATVSGTAVTLSWNASTDDCGVAEYVVTRTAVLTGEKKTLTSSGTSLIDKGLDPLTGYTYTVTAKDGAGHASAPSTPVAVTTEDGPQITYTTVYYKLPSGWTTANIHYQVGSGKWTDAPGVPMTASGIDGWVKFEMDTTDAATATMVFNNNAGTWDNNNEADYTVQTGGSVKIAGGQVSEGVPTAPVPMGETFSIYYKTSWANPHFHYQVGNGNWTTAPGNKMERVESCEAGDGWFKYTLDTNGATSVTGTFNDGSNDWDNNGGNNYKFTTAVAAVSNGQVSDQSPCGDVLPAKPGVPTGLKATVSGTDANVSWNAVSGADEYVVTYGPAGSGATKSVTVKTTSTTIKSLTPGDHWVTVAASNKGGTSAASAKVAFTILDPAVPQGIPQNLRAKTVSGVTTLSWDAVEGATKYRVDYGVLGQEGGDPAWVTTTSHSVSLPLGVAHWAKISAATDKATGVASPAIKFIPTAPAALGIPRNVKVDAVDGDTTVTWDRVPGATEYQVTYGVVGETGVQTARVTTTSFNTTLPTGVEQWVKVAASNGTVVGVASPATKFFPTSSSTPMGVPQNVQVKTVNGVTTVTWDAVQGATKYRVDLGITGQVGSESTWVTTNSYSASLTLGVEQWVKVSASNGVSVGVASTGVTFTPTAPTAVPTVPKGLKATGTTESTISLSWTAVSGATGYTVKYGKVGETGQVEVKSDQNSVKLKSLASDTEYRISVSASNDGGASAYSSEIKSRTTKAPVVQDGYVEPTRSGSVAGATTGTPLGGDPREDSIYFMMTARWYDGDESNNRGGNMHVKSGNAANDDPMFRGDFAGVIEKLDYIKGLGFSAIWITPVVLNRSDYDFHGYHGWDFQVIDPRLESEGASYQDLINAAHAKGIKIYQDVVYNHSSRWGEANVYQATVFGKRDNEWDWYYKEKVEGREYNPLGYYPDGSTYNGDMWSETQPEGQNCLHWGEQFAWSAEGYQVYHCQWPNATSGMFPEEYYHNCWIGNWEGKDSIDCWIHEDLADFNTESKVVQDYLIDTYNKYIDMGVDGFRVDTAVHVPRVMWNRHFLPAIQEHATAVHGEKGKDFYVFGEVAQFVHDKWNRGSVNHSAPFFTWKERKQYSSNDTEARDEQFHYENDMGIGNQPTSDNHLLYGNEYHTPDHSKFSGMNIIDMRMHMNFSNAWSAFGNGMDSDDVTNDATYNAVYVDSHDYGPNKSSNRYSEGTDAWAENMSLMWTFRGVPTLYYGSEIEFQKGAQIDCGPTCPLASTGRAYFGDHLEGSVTASDFGVVSSASGAVADTLNQPLAKHLQTLNQIRRAVPALQKGQYSTEGVSGGGMAFKRRFTEGGVDSFVLVTISGNATFSGIPNGRYVDAVTGDTINVGGGSASINAPGKGNMRAYVLDLPGNPAPGKVGNGNPFLK